jgi:hypothetical protein
MLNITVSRAQAQEYWRKREENTDVLRALI